MPTTFTEKTPRVPQEEAAGTEAGESAEAAESAGAAPGASGGLKPWLPLIVAIVSMPVLAFVTTRFILLPRIEHALSQPKSGAATETAADPAAAAAAATKDGKPVPAGKTKFVVPMSKLLVNVAGTMGTRYLMTSVSLVGTTPDFKAKIEENKDQLQDLATGALCTKTIADLEKPGARNQIRSELMNVMNTALGGPVIQEIYITELAIQ